MLGFLLGFLIVFRTQSGFSFFLEGLQNVFDLKRAIQTLAVDVLGSLPRVARLAAVSRVLAASAEEEEPEEAVAGPPVAASAVEWARSPAAGDGTVAGRRRGDGANCGWRSQAKSSAPN